MNQHGFRVLQNYIIRGGEHPSLRGEMLEQYFANEAVRKVLTDPAFAKKGLAWAYNILHFYGLYGNRSPEVLDYLYNERPYPEYIEIETTTFCDFRCKMCEQTYWKNERRKHLSYDEFLMILNQFPRLKWIGLTGIGQSFLNKDFPRMVDEVKKRGIYIELFDNFLYLNDDVAKHWVEIGVDRLYVSLDAATKKTYEGIRKNSNWDKVVENVKNLDRWKKKLNTPFPKFNFHFIVFKDNVEEMEQYVDFVHELGVEVESVQFTKALHDYKEIKELVVDIPEDLKTKVYNKGQSYGIECVFNVNTACNKPASKLCSVWWQPFIFSDGTVIPCCSLNEQNDRAWQRKTSLGNVFEKSFRDIWYGEKYGKMLEDLQCGKCPENCTRCVLYDFRGGEK